MRTRFSVFRGPGNQMIAISKEPTGDCWTIKSGEQGRKLRVTTVPVSSLPDFASVKSKYVNSNYQWLHDGHIDAYGDNVDATASSIAWEARNVDVVTAQSLLREYMEDLQSFGFAGDCVDSLSGTWLTVDRTSFGISRAPRPGCIHYENGYGAGTLFPASSADLLCLTALLAKSIDIGFADAKGTAIPRSKVINTCLPDASDPFVELLKKHGVQSMLMNLRVSTSRSLGF